LKRKIFRFNWAANNFYGNEFFQVGPKKKRVIVSDYLTGGGTRVPGGGEFGKRILPKPNGARGKFFFRWGEGPLPPPPFEKFPPDGCQNP